MIKKINIIVFWLLLCVGHGYAQNQNSFTLRSFYPARYGAYSEIFLRPQAIAETGSCRVGTIYFNNAGNFRCCQDDGTGSGKWGSPLVWMKNANAIFLDPALKENVGMGIVTEPGPGAWDVSNLPFKLTLDTDGGILAKGTQGGGAVLSTAGAGSRFIWYPRKAAFRAGSVDADEWNDVNIGENSFAVGLSTVASGSGIAVNISSTAFGYKATASGNHSVAMGYTALANDLASVAMGYKTFSLGPASLAIGYNSIAQAEMATAIGNVINAMGPISTAIGFQAMTDGHHSTAIGTKANASKLESTAIGYQSVASGLFSTAIGFRANATATDAVAIGADSRASGLRSVVLGKSQTTGQYAIAIGNGSLASGIRAFAMGYHCQALAEGSFALGIRTTAQAYHSFVFGRYNVISGDSMAWKSEDPLFVLGNGNDMTFARSNALTILKNGNVGIKTAAPKSRLHINGIIEYLNNAAALAAGLKPGDFYRTGDALKIVH